MEISEKSLLFRYAYLFDGDENKPRSYYRGRIHLCPFFWRCVLLQPFKIPLIGICIGIVYPFLLIANNICKWRIAYRETHPVKWKPLKRKKPWILWEALKAIHTKVCPIVKVVE